MTLPSSALRSGFRRLLCVAVVSGCRAPALSIDAPLSGAAAAGSPRESASPAGDGLVDWAPSSASPRPATAGAVLPICGRSEQSLLIAARELAQQTAAQEPWDVSNVVTRVRAAGGPFVWPRAWTLQAGAPDSATAEAGLAAWLERAPSIGERRCGTAEARAGEGRWAFAAVVVDVLADLDPLPTRARLGQWLRLRAHLLASAQSAETVLLGPHGAPRTIPTELRPGEVRSVFNLDQPGMWRIQLLLNTERGPRPAAEAWTFVDEEPNFAAALRPAPGEDLEAGVAGVSVSDLRARLLQMLNAARRSEQRLPVRDDPRLDELAQAHAEAMREAQQTAHDVGQGLPPERLRRAGIHAPRVGENVAHASSLGRAHRALWDSPAHRATLLDPGFSAVGVGIALEDEALDPEAGSAIDGVATNRKERAVRTEATAETAVLGARGVPAVRGARGVPAVSGVRGVPAVWVCELFAN